jgi:hypothetical protein
VLPFVTNLLVGGCVVLSWSFARNVLIVVVPLFLQKNPVEQLINRSCCLIIEHGENKIILLQESKLSKHKTGLSLFSFFLSFFLSSFLLCVVRLVPQRSKQEKNVKIRKI